MDLNFDKIFYITVKAMKVFQSHPDLVRDTKWFLKVLICHGMYTLVASLIMYNIIVDIKANEFSKACKNGVLCLLYVVVTLQSAVMLWYQERLKKIIEIMKNDYDSSNKLSLKERNVVLKYAKGGRWVTQQWFVIGFGGYFLFQLRSIALSLYVSLVEELQIVHFYEITYPGVIERNKNNVAVFIVTYGMMFFYATYAAIMYMAFVPLGPMFMLHACGQLEIVRGRIERVFNGRDFEEAKRELRAIVKYMQDIYSFIEDIETCFRLAYELTLKGTAIILPITFYELIGSIHNREISLEFVTFIFGGISFSGSPCYYSNLLMEKVGIIIGVELWVQTPVGDEICKAIYNSGWERVHCGSLSSTLMIILTRVQRPTGIRTLFRTLSLGALAEVLHQSYAIFNLINTMWH